MLDPQERRVLLEALTPPEGYQLDEGIGATYTLDLISLLSAPLAFTLFEWEDSDGEPNSNPVVLLQALRQNMQRLTIFCQAGRIGVPSKANVLFGYLEESIVEVMPGRGRAFHPKVWVLRYASAAGVRYRLICLTRNLTDDRCWDLSLVLEGPLIDRRKAFAVNHPLADFVAALPALAQASGRTVPPSVKERATRMADELRRVDFASELPKPFEEIAFLPLGIDGYRRWPFPESCERGLVVSPFLEASTLERLAGGKRGNILVSRAEELAPIDPAALARFDEVFVLSNSAGTEYEPESDQPSEAAASPRGLHAKLYVCDAGWDSHVFVGSANASWKAFKDNIEFLVRLTGKKSRVGVDEILAAEDGEACLRDLLVPYSPPDQPQAEDAAEKRLDELLEAARCSIVEANWKFQAGQEADQWHLRLVGGGRPVEWPPGVRVRAWPITLPESTGAVMLRDAITLVEFGNVGVAALTSFLACEIEGTVEGLTGKARFVLNLPLEGAPPDRREALLRAVLDDPSKVLRLLYLLLGEEPTTEPAGVDKTSGTEDGRAAMRPDETVLLEALLRTLAKDPTRLDEIDSIFRELDSGSRADSVLPPGLRDVWPAIWGARQAVRL